MSKCVNLNVVQGIGDIFWIYQKLAPHVDQINLNILAVNTDKVQQRSLGFIKLLPKIGSTSYKIVSSAEYDSVASQAFSLYPILDNTEEIYNYACNSPLEKGIRLENIEPGLAVEWNVPVYSRQGVNIPWDKYQILYVSGSKPDFAWKPHVWAELMLKMRALGHSEPIVLFGAPYDQVSLEEIKAILDKNDIETMTLIGLKPEHAVHVLKHASYFTGYQSGLNIMSDNFGIPQTMLYFPFLKPMLNSWCQPGHAEKGLFNAFTFDQNVDTVVKELFKRAQLA